MLPFRLTGQPDSRMPLYLYGVGTQEEKGLHRPGGFPVYQLFLARNGGGQFNISGRGTIVMGSGQLFALGPGIAHEYIAHTRTGGELGFIGIGGESANSVLQATGIMCERPRTLTGFDLIWSQMTELWKGLDQGGMSMWQMSTLIYQLILDLAQAMAPVGYVSHVHGNSDAGQEGLNRAIVLMQAHYQDDLLLKHVAEAVGYSVQHLNRLFHQHYGVTGHQYMQRWRLQKGLEWLNEHPEASVKEAAENVGMEVNYFIRMFKREFGETPGKGMKLRNQLRLEQDHHPRHK
ncbi:MULTISPECIES: AraC family transcriptional regulator [Paenibacillus]|uniref:Helix-turn-helix transcriptional regulator n=1 Tax=Paenibacillus cucumis (ex Kampfer et al. 2016) TaxID=1776858 RepID=A0ABS7KHL6_9BACL|nr:AraC family transcriptional regulator [Paenibacillus cucumis (ex Kampfer et al. 2016)]MBY0203643.1 helix-turn-helix transcriptional regulator [Paenibacillus cucumis (ex Kampfer et al. 2016)]